MNFLQHILSALASSLILTTILVITQCRHTFGSIRTSFIENVRRRNASSASSNNNNNTKRRPNEGTYTIAFFHPYCSSGGGGERVLWKIIQALGQMKEDACQQDDSDGKKRPSNSSRSRQSRSKYDKEVKGFIGGNCENLSVVIYTVDEPTENYHSGWYFSVYICICFTSFNTTYN